MASSWFDKDHYLASKLTHLQQADPEGNWTLESMFNSFATANVALNNDGLYTHFLEHGAAEDVAPHPLFNAQEYYYHKAAVDSGSAPSMALVAQTAQGIKAAGMNAWTHYMTYGSKEGVNPSFGFNATAYCHAKAEIMNNNGHLNNGEAWTAESMANAIHDAGHSILSHYLEFRGTSADEVESNASFTSEVPYWFDHNTYLNNYLGHLNATDSNTTWTWETMVDHIAASNFTCSPEGAYAHFIAYGNQANIAPNALFNAEHYLYNLAAKTVHGQPSTTQIDALAKELHAEGLTAWNHYLQYGSKAGINPSFNFDAHAYCQAKAEIMNQNGNLNNGEAWTAESMANVINNTGYSVLGHYLEFRGAGHDEVDSMASFQGNTHLSPSQPVPSPIPKPIPNTPTQPNPTPEENPEAPPRESNEDDLPTTESTFSVRQEEGKIVVSGTMEATDKIQVENGTIRINDTTVATAQDGLTLDLAAVTGVATVHLSQGSDSIHVIANADNENVIIDGQGGKDNITVEGKAKIIAHSKDTYTALDTVNIVDKGETPLDLILREGKVTLDQETAFKNANIQDADARTAYEQFFNDNRLQSQESYKIVNGSGAITLNGGILQHTVLGDESKSFTLNGGTLLGSFAMGNGGNTITINSGKVYGEIKSGDGEDTITVNGGDINGRLHTGAGNDIITFNGGRLEGILETEAGNDELTINDGTFKGNIDLGADNDHAVVTGGSFVVESSNLVMSEIKLGKGDDSIDFSQWQGGTALEKAYQFAKDVAAVSGNEGTDTLLLPKDFKSWSDKAEYWEFEKIENGSAQPEEPAVDASKLTVQEDGETLIISGESGAIELKDNKIYVDGKEFTLASKLDLSAVTGTANVTLSEGNDTLAIIANANKENVVIDGKGGKDNITVSGLAKVQAYSNDTYTAQDGTLNVVDERDTPLNLSLSDGSLTLTKATPSQYTAGSLKDDALDAYKAYITDNKINNALYQLSKGSGEIVLNEGTLYNATLNAGATHLTLNGGTILGSLAMSDAGNSLTIESGSVHGEINTGAGGDTITLNGGDIKGSVNAGAGNDNITINAGVLEGALNAGAGDDALTINNGALKGQVAMEAGSDTVIVNGGSFAPMLGTLSISDFNLGDGNDRIDFSGWKSDTPLEKAYAFEANVATLSGGTGSDTLLLPKDFKSWSDKAEYWEFEKIENGSSQPGEPTVDASKLTVQEKGDTLIISGESGAIELKDNKIYVDGKEFSLASKLDLSAVTGTANVTLSEGKDTLTIIANSQKENVVIDGKGGKDNISVEGNAKVLAYSGDTYTAAGKLNIVDEGETTPLALTLHDGSITLAQANIPKTLSQLNEPATDQYESYVTKASLFNQMHYTFTKATGDITLEKGMLYNPSIDGDGKSFTIEGGTVLGLLAMHGNGNTLSLTGGSVYGEIQTGQGSDTITITDGVIAGRVNTGQGNDTLTFSGGKITGIIHMGDGNDTMSVTGGLYEPIPNEGEQEGGIELGSGNDRLDFSQWASSTALSKAFNFTRGYTWIEGGDGFGEVNTLVLPTGFNDWTKENPYWHFMVEYA